MNAGVPQGFLTSPLLFNIYINDLIVELSSIRGITVYAYADDLAITAKCRYSLEKANETIFRWCEDNKMKINKDKSRILYIPW